MPRALIVLLAAIIMLGVQLLRPAESSGQSAFRAAPAAAPVADAARAAAAAAAEAARAAAVAQPPGGATPPAAEAQGEAKKDADKEGTEEDKPKTIQRPQEPPQPPDPAELQAGVQADGKIYFQFRGQPWPGVLDWLARQSKMSLDWQELPGDYLNLTTQRGYTVEEARDLINSRLLARGYTLLVNDEILSVVKLEALDPGQVPRVTLEELAERMPHDFVKVSFSLDWMLAEQAAKELAPMISPHGKLQPLTNTNRVDAMDVVTNLRDIAALLRQEQSEEQQERLIKVFELVNVRATDVLTMLEQLMGIESKESRGPMTPQEMQMMQQQMRMMQQQAQEGQPPAAKKEEPEVHLVVNQRRNSILAHAPPDKMAIIEEAIRALDVPSNRTSPLLTPGRMRVYRLHSLDPEALVRTLEEIGELEPTTRLEVDTSQGAILAYASLADHLTIKQLVDRLDGSGRGFQVIRLRRLAADYVAGTVEFMMVGQQDQQQQGSRYISYYYTRPPQQQKSEDRFRVDADLENNYLLLWCNEIELEEVTNLLVKLGEIPPAGGRSERLRVLDTVSPDELPQLLERLRRAWPSLSPNPLTLPETETDEDESKSAPPDHERQPQLKQDAQKRVYGQRLQYALWQERQQGPPGQPAGREEPPVNLAIGPDGKIIISSDDTAALDTLEELLNQLAPPSPEYEVFRLKYADAYYVRENLVDFFSDEDSDANASNSRSYYYVYDYGMPQQNDDRRFRLSQRRKPRFIYDYDTNSILVHGADAQQMRVIRDLIAVYDQPESPDSQSARITKVFAVRYSRAQIIADAVKDVYRDLLSSNDKALQSQNPEEKNRQAAAGTTYIFNEGGNGQDSERTPVTFKGKLSIGVDAVSNTLLVSAEGETLMRLVSEMVNTLDEAARPLSTVSVLPVSGGVNADRIREVVSRILAEPPTATSADGQPQPANPPSANGNAPQQQ